MNIFFEESGQFKSASVLSQAGESFQVEFPGGKRTKVRAKDVLLRYENTTPEQLMEEAKTIASEIDLNFLWEVAGDDEFLFNDLGREYFGREMHPQEAAGLILCLHNAPMYFYKKGKGRYKPAPKEALKAALASIERKKQQAIIQAKYVETIKEGRLPDEMKANVRELLFKPDKNSVEYKALSEACAELHKSPERLLMEIRAFESPFYLHRERFLFSHFPKGTEFPQVDSPKIPNDLTTAQVQAFSIDDETTTEIDDAFSVTFLPDGKIQAGIHIAAPALGIQPNDATDKIARQRLSTVYAPGDKITMLPDEFVDCFTLGAGQSRPAVSLYTTIDHNDWSVTETQTKVELVPITENLRRQNLDPIITKEALENDDGDYPHKKEIAFLWKWIQVLEKTRMEKRASYGLNPEQRNRVDFNFYVDGDGVVTIERRQRNAPLEKIVSELMIYANSAWGKLLNDNNIPGIYRSQTRGGWNSKTQVRMMTQAAPHHSLGVEQYAWCTSPLRRYSDLVNQWQIIACVKSDGEKTSAPFRHKDADLYSIVSNFDAKYNAYAEFQSQMERYWCLRWLEQHDARQVDAVVIKEEVLRLQEIPLVLKIPGLTPLARGAQVTLDIIGKDEIDLTVQARLLEVKNASPIDDLLLPESDEEEISPRENTKIEENNA